MRTLERMFLDMRKGDGSQSQLGYPLVNECFQCKMPDVRNARVWVCRSWSNLFYKNQIPGKASERHWFLPALTSFITLWPSVWFLNHSLFCALYLNILSLYWYLKICARGANICASFTFLLCATCVNGIIDFQWIHILTEQNQLSPRRLRGRRLRLSLGSMPNYTLRVMEIT